MAAGRHQRLNQAARRALEAWIGPPPVPRRMQLSRPVTSPIGLRDRLIRLERWYGGPKGAAAAIGVSPTTYRNWSRGVTPRASNLGRIENVHQGTLEKQADTMPARRAQLQLLAASGADPQAGLRISSELQVDGYYNGQKETYPEETPHPPLSSNRNAHRGVNLGAHRMGPILRTYAGGGNLGSLLETYAKDIITEHTFTNSYFTPPEVEFTEYKET